MADTLNRDYPYPGGSEGPNGPYAFQALADAIDADVEAIDVRLLANEQTIVTRFDRTGADGSITTPTADVILHTGTITGARAGVYRVEGFGALRSASTTAGSGFVKAGTTKSYQRNDLDGTYRNVGAVLAGYEHPGGDLVISYGYDYAAGGAITLAGPGGSSPSKQPCAVTATYVGKIKVSA
jgi:hypothetical protein